MLSIVILPQKGHINHTLIMEKNLSPATVLTCLLWTFTGSRKIHELERSDLQPSPDLIPSPTSQKPSAWISLTTGNSPLPQADHVIFGWPMASIPTDLPLFPGVTQQKAPLPSACLAFQTYKDTILFPGWLSLCSWTVTPGTWFKVPWTRNCAC